MDKTLQTTAWKCLPREFREEVKKMWQSADKKRQLPHDAFLRGKYSILISLFGRHNLTSDAEGDDEMLTVSRKQIDALQGEIFKAIMDAHDADDWQDAAHYILDVMPRSFAALFGSKCLPDEEPQPAPKFRVGEKVRCLLDGKVYRIESRAAKYYYILSGCVNGIHEDYLIIHKNAQTASQAAESVKNSHEMASETENRESDHIADADKMFDGIVNQGFREHNRLHIAAMAMQAIISRGKGYDAQETADMALEYADALMHEAEKGGKR